MSTVETRFEILGKVFHERSRQEVHKGYTPDHDDTHTEGEIASAAACYMVGGAPRLWPWEGNPNMIVGKKDRETQLIIGMALALAEIERLRRSE